MTSFRPIPPQRAVQIIESAGISEPRRLIVEFAAAGLVKAYALVIETRQASNPTEIVRGAAIPVELWQRVLRQGAADDVWRGGTVRLSSVPAERAPEINITGISFNEKSLDRLIEYHGAKGEEVALSAGHSARPDPEGDAVPEARRRGPGPSAIPPGAMLATVNQTMAALGLGRTKINELMNDGRLVRRKVDGRTMIEVGSIHALAGMGS